MVLFCFVLADDQNTVLEKEVDLQLSDNAEFNFRSCDLAEDVLSEVSVSLTYLKQLDLNLR